jgi:hypothetical protein
MLRISHQIFPLSAVQCGRKRKRRGRGKLLKDISGGVSEVMG